MSKYAYVEVTPPKYHQVFARVVVTKRWPGKERFWVEPRDRYHRSREYASLDEAVAAANGSPHYVYGHVTEISRDYVHVRDFGKRYSIKRSEWTPPAIAIDEPRGARLSYVYAYGTPSGESLRDWKLLAEALTQAEPDQQLISNRLDAYNESLRKAGWTQITEDEAREGLRPVYRY